MDQKSWLTERFEENRPRLRGVAYRMLGSLNEAEDAPSREDCDSCSRRSSMDRSE